ncbi:helix-turn-helix domain-containing protein [Acinetobacter baumannii]|uniref:S24 family peptidase n=3 Tax=Acinetobacter baumannii TaxID=470 RepID=UPI0005990146|nr:S24 family peptidase [Acinetobacter baumannii]EHU1603690.1 helix-turn-helix domain-containing protein [Acinetobacter baumannii]EKT7999247.1 helix-turn-helix domain-containing protein [Acinetobacter baumannii]EKT8313493.1 helix-turn-helix domain-containing protein [Acinetobacter baumannii]EKT9116237.1 helix-turn-helix domain-containing protein [Acinetobacter baumannii]EKT9782768.1 helix-turn-helix domain-containing protein [Acinetobacter baumannii]
MDNSVSDRIQSRMAELKLSQADLMRLTGAARGTVSGWVNGSNNPSAKHIEALATALKTTSRWILTGKEKQNLTNFNMQEFMDKHGLSKKDESSFDVNDIQSPSVVEYGGDDGFIWIDVVEASFSCGTGESIEFHFDVINGKQPFPPSFFKQKNVHPDCMRIIKAKGDSMADKIDDGDLVGIDISQTDIIDGQIYAVYFEGEGMIKQIFKEEGGKLILHSLNPKYRDREVTEQNGLNFKVMGRQFWRAG